MYAVNNDVEIFGSFEFWADAVAHVKTAARSLRNTIAAELAATFPPEEVKRDFIVGLAWISAHVWHFEKKTHLFRAAIAAFLWSVLWLGAIAVFSGRLAREFWRRRVEVAAISVRVCRLLGLYWGIVRSLQKMVDKRYCQ